MAIQNNNNTTQNNTISDAFSAILPLPGASPLTLDGSLNSSNDVDLISLGNLQAGDRVTINVNTNPPLMLIRILPLFLS